MHVSAVTAAATSLTGKGHSWYVTVCVTTQLMCRLLTQGRYVRGLPVAISTATNVGVLV